MPNMLQRLFAGTAKAPPPGRRHEAWPAAIYAIGDIHGCIGPLRALEERIFADGAGIDGEKWIIWLGDLVDRGPDSASVLDRALAPPPPGFRRFCLAGNHDAMMLDFLRHPSPRADWLTFGGRETLSSYGMSGTVFERAGPRQMRDIVASHIPAEHIELLGAMPLWIAVPGTVFVHAGIRRGLPLERQRAEDLLWIRDAFFAAPADDGLLVVHGHTPGPEPVVCPGRIGLDTGCFATGVLSAARFQPGAPPQFLSVGSPPQP